jgi:hypothetical protein
MEKKEAGPLAILGRKFQPQAIDVFHGDRLYRIGVVIIIGLSHVDL